MSPGGVLALCLIECCSNQIMNLYKCFTIMSLKLAKTTFKFRIYDKNLWLAVHNGFFVLVFTYSIHHSPRRCSLERTDSSVKDVHDGKSLGGADAEGSPTGMSPWGGFNLMVLKKLVTWPGISAKTLWVSISWGAWGEETHILWREGWSQHVQSQHAGVTLI